MSNEEKKHVQKPSYQESFISGVWKRMKLEEEGCAGEFSMRDKMTIRTGFKPSVMNTMKKALSLHSSNRP